MKCTLPLLFALLCCVAVPTAAQDSSPTADSLAQLALPRNLAEPITAFFNDPATLHFRGATRIPAERALIGDVAVLGGPVTIAGRIDGDLVVINGDIELLPGAVVTGDLTVVGGHVAGMDVARIGGQVLAYSERLPYRDDGTRIVYTGEAEERPRRQRAPRDGRSDFLITTGQSYNRVEGLPVTFGPVIETAGDNPFRLKALAIYRTESGATLDVSRLGYDLRAEQLFGQRRFHVGASLFSVIDPIEEWHLSNLENGLATFLLHRDYRDHYEREGASVFAGYRPAGLPLSLSVESRWERHAAVPVGSPWTLFGNDRGWRPQPLAARGDLQSVVARAEWDSRDQPDNPSTGWYVRGHVEQSLNSDLVRPAVARFSPTDLFPPDIETFPAQRYTEFRTGRVDIRRYNRVSPDSRLNLRLLAAGSLDGSALPPQRQHALGGEGSLPGYRLFSRDCGARADAAYRAAELPTVPLDGTLPPTYFVRYGCDAIALVQAEYRGKLSFRFHWGDNEESSWLKDDDWDLGWTGSPDWVAFVDAGRGWVRRGSAQDAALPRPAGSEEVGVDLGIGVLLDKVGVYVAAPLRGAGGLNLFVRLGPRF